MAGRGLNRSVNSVGMLESERDAHAAGGADATAALPETFTCGAALADLMLVCNCMWLLIWEAMMIKACGGITQRHACRAEKQQQRLAVTCSTNVESFAEVSKKGISRESANFWREKASGA